MKINLRQDKENIIPVQVHLTEDDLEYNKMIRDYTDNMTNLMKLITEVSISNMHNPYIPPNKPHNQS